MTKDIHYFLADSRKIYQNGTEKELRMWTGLREQCPILVIDTNETHDPKVFGKNFISVPKEKRDEFQQKVNTLQDQMASILEEKIGNMPEDLSTLSDENKALFNEIYQETRKKEQELALEYSEPLSAEEYYHANGRPDFTENKTHYRVLNTSYIMGADKDPLISIEEVEKFCREVTREEAEILVM